MNIKNIIMRLRQGCTRWHEYFDTNIRKFMRFILILFMTINAVFGFVEVSFGFVFSFLRNHREGHYGFTDKSVEIGTIVDYEHKDWELEKTDSINSINDLPVEQIQLLENRRKMIRDCSNFPDDIRAHDIESADCLVLNPDLVEKNYFCAIVEHPERFDKAFLPMATLFLATALLYLGTVPLVLLCLIWKSQSTNLLKFYTVLQIAPVAVSIYTLYLLQYRFNFELCGLDHLHPGRNRITTLFTAFAICKMILRVIECGINMWFLHSIHIQELTRAAGINGASGRTVPVPRPIHVGRIPRPSQVTPHLMRQQTSIVIENEQDEEEEDEDIEMLDNPNDKRESFPVSDKRESYPVSDKRESFPISGKWESDTSLLKKKEDKKKTPKKHNHHHRKK